PRAHEARRRAAGNSPTGDSLDAALAGALGGPPAEQRPHESADSESEEDAEDDTHRGAAAEEKSERQHAGRAGSDPQDHGKGLCVFEFLVDHGWPPRRKDSLL